MCPCHQVWKDLERRLRISLVKMTKDNVAGLGRPNFDRILIVALTAIVITIPVWIGSLSSMAMDTLLLYYRHHPFCIFQVKFLTSVHQYNEPITQCPEFKCEGFSTITIGAFVKLGGFAADWEKTQFCWNLPNMCGNLWNPPNALLDFACVVKKKTSSKCQYKLGFLSW